MDSFHQSAWAAMRGLRRTVSVRLLSADEEKRSLVKCGRRGIDGLAVGRSLHTLLVRAERERALRRPSCRESAVALCTQLLVPFGLLAAEDGHGGTRVFDRRMRLALELDVDAQHQLGELLETWVLCLCQVAQRLERGSIARERIGMREQERLRSFWMACPTSTLPLMSAATSPCTSLKEGAPLRSLGRTPETQVR